MTHNTIDNICNVKFPGQGTYWNLTFKCSSACIIYTNEVTTFSQFENVIGAKEQRLKEHRRGWFIFINIKSVQCIISQLDTVKYINCIKYKNYSVKRVLISVIVFVMLNIFIKDHDFLCTYVQMYMRSYCEYFLNLSSCSARYICPIFRNCSRFAMTPTAGECALGYRYTC